MLGRFDQDCDPERPDAGTKLEIVTVEQQAVGPERRRIAARQRIGDLGDDLVTPFSVPDGLPLALKRRGASRDRDLRRFSQ
jgi:hypothetical protein